MKNTIPTTNSCLQYSSTLCHTVFLHRTVSVRFSYTVVYYLKYSPITILLLVAFMKNTIPTTNSCLQYISTLCHTVFLHRTASVRFSYAVRFPYTVRLIPQIFTYYEFIACCSYKKHNTHNKQLFAVHFDALLCSFPTPYGFRTVFVHRTFNTSNIHL